MSTSFENMVERNLPLTLIFPVYAALENSEVNRDQEIVSAVKRTPNGILPTG